jgi:DNA polymerase III epsilon subunit-like protein
MTKAKYICFDTETGGRDETKNPILTAFFLALDENFQELDSLDIAIRPEAPFDLIEDEALGVNGIVMADHMARTDLMSREEAGKAIMAFCKKNKVKSPSEPMGHNVQFDIDMLKAQLLTRQQYKDSFHYRVVDTFPICNLFKQVGFLPKESGKLTSIADHYGIHYDKAHEAKADVYLCVKVYKKMIETIESLKNNAGASSKSILELIEQ